MSTLETLCFAWRLLRPNGRRLTLAVSLGVGALGSSLALAALSAWLITRAWQMPPVLDLAVAVVAVRALGISRAVLGYCHRLAGHDTALRAAGQARWALFERLANGPVQATMRLRSGELVARLGSDVDELSDLLVRTVLPVGVAAVLAVAAIVAVGVISLATAALLAVALTVAGVVAPLLAGRAVVAGERAAARHREARDTSVMTLLEHTDQLRVGGRLPKLIDDVAAEQRAWASEDDAAARPMAFAVSAQVLAVGAAVVGATLAGIVLSDHVAPTTVAVLMLLPLSAFEATGALPSAAVALVKARLAANRLKGLTRGSTEPSQRVPRSLAPPAPGAVLTTQGLHSGFAPETANGPFDCDLSAGARLAVLGPSGSGKTALLMTLAGLLEPQSGLVTVSGVPIDELAEGELRSHILFFGEDAHLFDTTVRDNLLVARGDATDDEVTDALDRVGLAAWADGLPDGLDTILESGGQALSAGQRRRLLLARVLLTSAPIVLLDEPTEHLDADDSDALMRALLDPEGGLVGFARTVVVATHHMPRDLRCSRIVLSGNRTGHGRAQTLNRIPVSSSAKHLITSSER